MKQSTESSELETKLLTDGEGSAAEIINPNGQTSIVLVCEHASNFIPASLYWCI